MDAIEKAVAALTNEDLDTKKRIVCYIDVSCGMDWKDCLHDWEKMSEGIINSDPICPHCYDEDEGFGNMSRDLAARVFYDIKKFDEYRNARAGT